MNGFHICYEEQMHMYKTESLESMTECLSLLDVYSIDENMADI